MKTWPSLAATCLLASAVAQANDFPTSARVEYVLKCMNEHGGQRYETLYKCSCSLDKLATQISYDEFAEAQTYLYLRRTPGERGSVFRDPPQADTLRDKLVSAKQNAKASCFL